MVRRVDKKSLYTVGDLGSGETLWKKLHGDYESGIGSPVRKMKSNVACSTIIPRRTIIRKRR